MLTILSFGFNYFFDERKFFFEDEKDIGRNERSTPRTFVLPATPAVALIQEKKFS